jgi:hypothetical protein
MVQRELDRHWLPPPHGLAKMNVDATVSQPGKGSYRCCLPTRTWPISGLFYGGASDPQE